MRDRIAITGGHSNQEPLDTQKSIILQNFYSAYLVLTSKFSRENRKTSKFKRQARIYRKIGSWGVVVLGLLCGKHLSSNMEPILDHILCFLLGVLRCRRNDTFLSSRPVQAIT